MNFKNLLSQLDQLSEATKETEKGRIHKAEPGGYGRKFDTDEEGDEKKDDKKEPAVKRGRGRPKKGADSETGQVAKYDNAKNLQSFMVGNIPKKGLPGKPGKKHTLKDWVEQVEAKYVAETAPGQQLTVKPMPGAAQLVDPASNKVMATGDAASVKNIQGAVAQGKIQMRGEEMAEGDEDYSAKKARAGKDIGKPGKQFGKIAASAGKKYGSKAAGERVAGAVLSKLRQKTNEADIPSDQNDMGAGLGAARNQTTLESKKDFAAKFQKNIDKSNKDKKETAEKVKAHNKDDKKKVEEAAKPDFLDIDKDKNKKESMKDAAKDAKKKKVNESAHRHSAARLLGKAHALAKEAYNCKYDDLEEVRMYHEGFKEGLDECYGQGVYEEAPAATTGGMASQAMPAMEAEFEEGNAFTKALAQTPTGGKFSVGGKTFTDRSSYDSKIDEFAFESLDKQLNALLNEDSVSEGMTVSISKGQQGAPDSVTVSAQDGEADQLLGLIKQAGLGLFGDDNTSGYGAPSDGEMTQKHQGIDVVGDHDGMMSLIKKVTGAEDADSDESHDYEDEVSHDHHDHEDHEHVDEETCQECGMMESDCECDKEAVDEVESYDQEEEIAAESNAPDSDAAETTADENAEAEEDQALADEEQVTEWANDAGEKSKDFDEEQFEADMNFMTKVISGGLNKQKSTGQTTVPVIANQTNRTVTNESILDWKKLAGIK